MSNVNTISGRGRPAIVTGLAATGTSQTTALLLAIRALAQHQGVEAALLEQWRRSQPDVLARSDEAARVSSRAWRWSDEMDEIAQTFEDAGLPGGAAHVPTGQRYLEVHFPQPIPQTDLPQRQPIHQLA